MWSRKYKLKRTDEQIKTELNKLLKKEAGDDFASGALDMFYWLIGRNEDLPSE